MRSQSDLLVERMKRGYGNDNQSYKFSPSLIPAGRPVRLQLITRRFRCGVGTCRRKIFAKRFGEPTLQNVLILALIVLIRTFLSLSLTVEIEGRWPWAAGRPTPAARQVGDTAP